jgi:hypothetical protein
MSALPRVSGHVVPISDAGPFVHGKNDLSIIRTSLRHCQSLFPGSGILMGRDSGVEKVRHIRPIVNRDKEPARKSTNPALFAHKREISVCMGLRGGPGRTRTSNQAVMRRHELVSRP